MLQLGTHAGPQDVLDLCGSLTVCEPHLWVHQELVLVRHFGLQQAGVELPLC